MKPYVLRPGFWRADEEQESHTDKHRRPRSSVASNARDYRTPRKVERHEAKLETVGLVLDTWEPESWNDFGCQCHEVCDCATNGRGRLRKLLVK